MMRISRGYGTMLHSIIKGHTELRPAIHGFNVSSTSNHIGQSLKPTSAVLDDPDNHFRFLVALLITEI